MILSGIARPRFKTINVQNSVKVSNNVPRTNHQNLLLKNFLSSSNVCLIFSSVASTTSPPVLPCPDGGNPGSSLVTASNSNMPSTVKTTITATAGVTAGLPNSNRYISTPYLLGLIPTYKLRHMTKFKSPFTLCIVCLLPTIARVKLHRKGDYLHGDAPFFIYIKRLRCFPTSSILIFLRLCFF